MTTPLIDGDVLVYQASFAGQMNTDMGETIILPFDRVADFLDDLINSIVDGCWGTEDPIIFLTHDESVLRHYNREIKYTSLDGEDVCQGSFLDMCKRSVFNVERFVPNFRYDVAKTAPYKGNRKSSKPFHYHNVRAYLMAKYDVIIVPGLEADDALGLYQMEMYKDIPLNTPIDISEAPSVICSRDKDLRIIPGFHYGWPAGAQLEQPIKFITELGYLEMDGKKLRGGGMKFFFSQMLMGDSVDNIPGIPLKGPVFAYKTFSPMDSIDAMAEETKALYEAYRGSEGPSYFKEQARLLWMVGKIDKQYNMLGWDGEPYEYKIRKPLTLWRN